MPSIPVQEEVAALDYYVKHFVWGGLQQTTDEKHPYAIYGIPDWHRNRTIRRRGARKITGQKAAVTRAEKSIAQFKVRRKACRSARWSRSAAQRMYEFVDRLVAIALPRVRDFRGVSARGFDGRGNYTLGLRDQLMFPEIDYLKVDKSRGMNISFVTTARTDEEARRLLQLMGMPFRQN